MSTADIDVQLKVWKELAVSKQVLMGVATDALGLSAECTTTELKEALQNAISRAKEADANIIQTREKADKDIAEMKQIVDSSNKARTEAEEKIAEAEEARENADRQLAAGRANNAETVKKARAEVVEHQNKLKAISKALADTPENVVKKLKNLKKQKMDEANLRKQVETQLKTARKEKTKLETEIKEQGALIEKAATLVEQYKTLHALSNEQNQKIISLSENKDDLFEIPALDEELLTALAAESSEE